MKEIFRTSETEFHVTVEVKGLSADSAAGNGNTAGVYAENERYGCNERRMGSFYANMPDEVTLTVNGNHPIYQQILKEGNEELKKKQVRNLADLALLSQGLLKGAELTNFINRSVEILQAEVKTEAESIQ